MSETQTFIIALGWLAIIAVMVAMVAACVTFVRVSQQQAATVPPSPSPDVLSCMKCGHDSHHRALVVIRLSANAVRSQYTGCPERDCTCVRGWAPRAT